jgi:peptidoglycan glycosyltransferase
MNRAIRRVGFASIVLVLILVGQLTYLQIVDADNLAHDPRNVRAALRDANRPRGPIVTADGVVLARSTEVDDGTEFKFQREYPEGAAFSQVVGYQSFVFGNTGVEQTYNDQLVGRDAELQINNIPDLVEGSDATGTVVLSLRADMQRAAIDGLHGQRGSVVALDTVTGRILAMYSNPTFDPNPYAGHDTQNVQAYNKLLNADANKPALPRAYRERYSPGSTFKVVTASVGIETGVTSPDKVYPTLRELDLPQTDATLRNFGGRSCGGPLSLGLTVSCNTTFGQVGLDLGDQFVPGMEKFGVNATPPLDIAPGAVSSIAPLPPFQDNQPQYAFAGIGQGVVTTTPLEMALVAAGIANGGVIMQPHVGAEIRDSNGDLVRKLDDKQWRTAVNPATAQAVNSMMQSVVNSGQGTGTAARINGVTVAGKSGTAQAPNNQVNAWFIAFAPAEGARVAVAVILEGGGDAGNEATGGKVAAPIARDVLRVALGA